MIAKINTGSRLARKLIAIVWLVFAMSAKSQDVYVEKSVLGVQTGFLGIWLHGELRMASEFALRLETGLDAGIWGGTYYEKVGFLLTPVLTAEPRWYYNLATRDNRLKEVEGNSGNFISVKTSFHPDWFVISNCDDLNEISDVSVIPTWGIRRKMGKLFNYEAGIGVGYRYIFARKAGYPENESSVAYNLHLRVGYKF